MKKVIVTGSEGLIGKDLCDFLEREKYEVVRCDLSLGHDLTDESFTKNFFSNHKCDYLINLFAYNDHVNDENKTNNIFDVSLESFNRFLKINLTALFSVCREYARNNSRGSIVNVSSLYSILSPDPHLYRVNSEDKKEKHIAYGVTKAGVEQLTRHLAVHLAPNFRVNCVAPGGIGEPSQPDHFVEKFTSKTLMNRMMKQSDLYGIFLYLCSNYSEYTTGQTFRINGGYGCR